MTWYLRNRDAAPTPAAPAVTGPTPSWGQQAGGIMVDYWKRRDTWGSEEQYRAELTNEMTRALAPDGRLVVRPEDQREYQDPRTRGAYLARQIGALQAVDTDGRFAGLPVSPEEFDAAVIARRKRDFDENRAMLDRGDSTSARIVGTLGAGVVDPWNVATAPIGGGGSVLKYALTQGAVNAATELPGIVREQSVAKDLGFTPDNPVVAVGTAAAGGVVLGGAIGGAGRVIDYVRDTRAARRAARPGDIPGADYEDVLARTEADLKAGREPRAPSAYRPDPALPAAQDPAVQNIARYIGRIEANGDWNIVYAGSVIKPPRPITTMTVDEVLAWQARSDAAGSKSTAVGGFQIIRDTLSGLKGRMGLTGDEVFDEAMQTRMGIELMRGRGLEEWRAGRISTDQFIDNMAQEWAAIPRATTSADGRQAGRSHYDGDGLNSARATLDETRAVFGGQSAPGGMDLPAPQAGWDAPIRTPGWFDQVTTPAGTNVDVEYRVVDLSDLRAASGDLQPRDRSRVSSDEQIAEIAARLDPRRLMPAIEADRGAPIIGPDMIVESGNGRVGAIGRAVTEHPDRYQAYVDQIRAAGYEVPEGVSRPVLVAQRRTDLDPDARRRFVRENNTSAIARMSATEQARTNAGYLSQRAFDAYQPGTRLAAPENTEFLRRFFATMPQPERAPFIGKDGRLTIDGLRMVRQSLFHRAFEADDLLRLLAETESPALTGLVRMMEDIAPDWAAFRAMVDAGYVRPEFDITEPLVDMIRQIARARMDGREGQSVIAALRDALDTADMFTARDPAMTDALIGVFYKGDRARSAETSQAILQRYIADAQAVGRADSADLLAPVTPAEALGRAAEAQDARAPMPPGATATVPSSGPAGPLADLRGLSGDASPEGAVSPAMIRATDGARRELAEPADIAPAPPGGPAGETVSLSRAELDDALADARSALADQPDLEIRLGEGADAPSVSLADVMRDLDDDETLIARMTSCGLKGVPR